MRKTPQGRLGTAAILGQLAAVRVALAATTGTLLLTALMSHAQAIDPAGETTSSTSTSSTSSTARPPLMFGASGSTRELVESHERVLGQRLNGLRVYKDWDDTLFSSSQVWARDTGHTLFLSISARRNGGGMVRWSDIATARPGSRLYADMVRQAQQIKAFGDKVYIAFNHEPETNSSWYGTPAQFASAWRKIVSTYRAAGVTNAEYVLTLTAWGFARHDGKNAASYYPGDAYVDHIAADGYNWYRCRDGAKWRELSSIIEAHRRFGMLHPGKGLMLWEFGSTEDPAVPGRKAQWFRNAQALFSQPAYSQYKAVISWEGRLYTRSRNNCGFDYNSSASARDAWKAMGTSPMYSASTVG
jgi:hypothetical protein